MEKNNGGFIVIARKIKSWGWYSDPTTFCLFIHLLIMANWKDGYFEGRLIKRGQLATSIKSLALKTGLSIKQVKGSLNKLRGTHEITTEGLARYTVITVVKYNEYQTSNQLNNQETTNKTTSRTANKQPSSNQVATTTEESNKDNKGKKKRVKPPHRGWIPYVYHDSEWLRAHDPRDGWRFTEIDGVGWAYQEKVEG